MSSEKAYLLEPDDLKDKKHQKQIKMFLKKYKTFQRSSTITSHYMYVNVQKVNNYLTSCFKPYKYVDTDMIPYTDTTKYKTYICYNGYFYILIDFEKEILTLYKLPVNYKFSYGPNKYDAVDSEEPIAKFEIGNSDIIHYVSIKQQIQNVKNNIENNMIVLPENAEGYRISFTFM
jgi:hypothetical protein